MLESELVKFGIAGIFIAYLIYNSKQKDDRYDKLLEAHLAENKEAAEALLEESKRNSDAVKVLADSIKDLATSVDVVVATTAAATRTAKAS